VIAPLGDLAALGIQQVRDRLQRGGLARAVAAQQRGDAALGHAQLTRLQHEDHVVVDHLDVVDRKQGLGLGGSADRGRRTWVGSCRFQAVMARRRRAMLLSDADQPQSRGVDAGFGGEGRAVFLDQRVDDLAVGGDQVGDDRPACVGASHCWIMPRPGPPWLAQETLTGR
jgi:hypothetical protein